MMKCRVVYTLSVLVAVGCSSHNIRSQYESRKEQIEAEYSDRYFSEGDSPLESEGFDQNAAQASYYENVCHLHPEATATKKDRAKCKTGLAQAIIQRFSRRYLFADPEQIKSSCQIDDTCTDPVSVEKTARKMHNDYVEAAKASQLDELDSWYFDAIGRAKQKDKKVWKIVGISLLAAGGAVGSSGGGRNTDSDAAPLNQCTPGNRMSEAQCPIVGNRKSGIFHTPYDRHYDMMLECNQDGVDNRACFETSSSARAAGYRECGAP